MNTDTIFIIADNQDITRRGMHGYISDLFEGCHTEDVADKRELLQALTKHNECLVIFDYTLFDMNGVEEFLIIEKRFPDVRWLLFSDELSEQFIRRLGVEKNVGMILKESSGEEIRTALKCMALGERFLCHQITELLISNSGRPEHHSVLTATETDILKLIARGKSVKEASIPLSPIKRIYSENLGSTMCMKRPDMHYAQVWSNWWNIIYDGWTE